MIRASSRERARLLAYVPQSHVATFAFSVETIVLMGRIAHGNLFNRPTAIDRAIAGQALEQLGISHLRERPYTMSSGGERQLVLLARALPRWAQFGDPAVPANFGRMKNAERYRRSADVDRRDDGITRCSDDRYGIVKLVRDVGLAAVRRECDADGAVANGDRRRHSVPNLLHNIVYLTNLYGAPILETPILFRDC